MDELIARNFAEAERPARRRMGPEDALGLVDAETPGLSAEESERRAIELLQKGGFWRSAAVLCGRRIASSANADGTSRLSADEIMWTWSVRLDALCKLGMWRIAESEVNGLGEFEGARFRVSVAEEEREEEKLRMVDRGESRTSISSISSTSRPRKQRTRNLLAFDLRLAAARIPAGLGDLDTALGTIARIEWDCANELRYAREAGSGPEEPRAEEEAAWTRRILECRLLTASLLLSPSPTSSTTSAPNSPIPSGASIPPSDPINASSILFSILSSPDLKVVDINGRLRKATMETVARLALQLGALERAAGLSEALAKEWPDDARGGALNSALERLLNGDAETALGILSPWANETDPTIQTMLSISHLYAAKPSIEGAMGTASAVPDNVLAVSPAMIFNLATLYELVDGSGERKKGLVRRVVANGAGEGAAVVAGFKLG
jgi:hypothetical protein